MNVSHLRTTVAQSPAVPVMKTTIDFLNDLNSKLGDASDYRVAKELGVTKATVSTWRVGKGTMGEDAALRVADLLGEDPKFVLACVLAERSKSKKAKQVLRQIADGLRRTAAAIAIAIAGFLGVSHAPPARAASVDSPVMYIMENHALGAGTPSTPAPAVILHVVPRSAPERHVVGS